MVKIAVLGNDGEDVSLRKAPFDSFQWPGGDKESHIQGCKFLDKVELHFLGSFIQCVDNVECNSCSFDELVQQLKEFLLDWARVLSYMARIDPLSKGSTTWVPLDGLFDEDLQNVTNSEAGTVAVANVDVGYTNIAGCCCTCFEFSDDDRPV